MRRTHGRDYEEFGMRVAECRQKMGLTQQEAADRLDMPQSTYAGYEAGTRKVPLTVFTLRASRRLVCTKRMANIV